MKHYRKSNGEIFSFEIDCFDENGEIINEIAKKVIEENKLIEMTEEEYAEIQAQKEAERLVEEERLAKLPAQEEIEKAKIELVTINLLTEAGLI